MESSGTSIDARGADGLLVMARYNFIFQNNREYKKMCNMSVFVKRKIAIVDNVEITK